MLVFPGKVTPESFERITEHVIRDYFPRSPLAGRSTASTTSIFSIYDLSKLVANFGSVRATAPRSTGFATR